MLALARRVLARLVGRGGAQRQPVLVTWVDAWLIELDGVAIGELFGLYRTDMFWKQCVVLGDDPRLFDRALWRDCRFRFRHPLTGWYALHAFCGYETPTPNNLYVQMRGLH